MVRYLPGCLTVLGGRLKGGLCGWLRIAVCWKFVLKCNLRLTEDCCILETRFQCASWGWLRTDVSWRCVFNVQPELACSPPAMLFDIDSHIISVRALCTLITQLLAMDVSARTTMKGAVNCERHCELQNSVNQKILERILCLWDIPVSMPTSVSIHSFEALLWCYLEACAWDHMCCTLRDRLTCGDVVNSLSRGKHNLAVILYLGSSGRA